MFVTRVNTITLRMEFEIPELSVHSISPRPMLTPEERERVKSALRKGLKPLPIAVDGVKQPLLFHDEKPEPGNESYDSMGSDCQ
jgi:hypothetical protein